MTTSPATRESAVSRRSPDTPLARYAAELTARYGLNDRVLLVQLPQFMLNAFSLRVARARGVYAWPPTGLQWVRHLLRDRGLDIRILDLNFEILRRARSEPSFDIADWLGILDAEIEAFAPAIVGITTINVSGDPEDDNYPLAAVLKHLRARDDRIVIAGGANATNDAHYFVETGMAHVVVMKEGDLRIPRLFDALYQQPEGTPPQAGIVFPGADGAVVEDGTQAGVVQPKGSIVETYADIPIEQYCQVGTLNPFSRMAGQDTPYATFLLNRGCRADCEFCGVTEFMGGRGLRQTPAEDVIAELRYLTEERGIRHFEVLDDDFLGKRTEQPGLVAVLTAMTDLRRRYGITWSAGNGLIASSLTPEVMDLIASSGCLGFRIGIETGNPDLIKAMRKPASLDSLRRSAELFRAYPDIFVGGNFILGIFGEETFGQMLDTFRFAAEIGVDWANYTVFQFTHTSETKARKVKQEGAKDFVPSKDSSSREIVAEDASILSGPDVFDLDPAAVPSREQVRHIWLSFNLVSNYICNRNLRPGGNPQKLLRWLEALMTGYPENVYMPLFAGLARTLVGDGPAAQDHYRTFAALLAASPLWQERFSTYGLDAIVARPPTTAEGVWEGLAPLWDHYDGLAGITEGAAGEAEAAGSVAQGGRTR